MTSIEGDCINYLAQLLDLCEVVAQDVTLVELG